MLIVKQKLIVWISTSSLRQRHAHWYRTRQTGQCGYFSISQNWSGDCPEELGGHWRCPICGFQYRPWLENDHEYGLLPANQLLVVENDDEPMQLPFGEDMAPGEIRFIPVWWVDTPAQALEMRVAEIFNEVDQEMADLPTNQLLSKIKDMALKTGSSKSFFHPMHMTDEAKAAIDYQNVNGKRAKKGYKFKYDHLTKPEGFLGAQFKWKPDMKALSQDNMARLWAYCRVAARAMHNTK